MVVLKWPSVALTGNAQTIPEVCPNCMGPAVVRYRYSYRSPFFLISRTSYFQSFGYCARCEPMMDAYFKWQNKGCLLYILYVAAIAGGVIAGIALVGPGKPLHAGGPVVTAAVVLAPVVILWLLLRMAKRKMRAAHPSQEGQVMFGPSAYYTGQTFGGMGNKHVYRAVRPEWLAALVRANPGSVDDATYVKMTGESAPAKGESKPFA